MTELCDRTATELSSMLRAGQTSSAKIAASCLARIDAVVFVDFATVPQHLFARGAVECHARNDTPAHLEVHIHSRNCSTAASITRSKLPGASTAMFS